ncbi:MAG: hypothetical protein KBC84_08260 [Proteobacteria bacterium]|nr:hypothetical protein [Pseudomonadota bacterium]
MDIVAKLQEISLRIDHLQQSGDWLARSLVHTDSPASQTGSLIAVLAEDVRDRVLELVSELEKQVFINSKDFTIN